jgi:PAS domain S-box-containing protein
VESTVKDEVGGAARPDQGFRIERDLLCTADAGGRFTSLNAAWERVLGWSREELMERPFLDFLHPDDVAATAKEMRKLVTRDYELVDFENRYRSKHGGWRWLRWSARSDGETWFAVAFDVTERKHLEEELRASLTADRLLAYSQPIIDGRSGRIVQQELLARLRGTGEDGVIAPIEFVPDAEACGLIGLVDRWMTKQAIAVAGAGGWAELNLSAVSIGDPRLTEELIEDLRRAGRDADRLVFEITETAALEHFDAALEFGERVLALGCHLALDDFGTGFGSLSYLRRLPFRFLKIDSSFVRDLPRSPNDQALVRSVVAIARELRLETVAEGVEDEATLRLLREYGVDRAQGYLFGHPRPVETAAAGRA